MDGLWVFLSIVVIVGCLSETVKIRYTKRSSTIGKELAEGQSKLLERLERLERRVANLEAIIVERNKYEEFDRLKSAV
jgi:hypothetical protein